MKPPDLQDYADGFAKRLLGNDKGEIFRLRIGTDPLGHIQYQLKNRRHYWEGNQCAYAQEFQSCDKDGVAGSVSKKSG